MHSMVRSVSILSVLFSAWVMAGPGICDTSVGVGETGADCALRETTSAQDRSGQATIEIRSEPSGASVYLDGEPKGQTPLTIPGVSLGPHSLELRLKGYPDFPTTIQVAEKNEPFTFRMVKPAILRVSSSVPQVEVWIEEHNYGRTTLQQPLQPGQYSVLLKKNLYFDSLVVVNIVEGQDLDLQVDLEPLPVTLDIEVEPIAAGVTVGVIGLQTQDGKASLSLRPGKHILTVSLNGYETQRLEINLEPGKSQRVPVKLEKQTSSKLVYYLVGGGVVGGLIYWLVIDHDGEVTVDKWGRPPAFPDPTK